ncbi:hypothetical protein BDK51DRAFT_7122, partial [Blyttiomyces helicus]
LSSNKVAVLVEPRAQDHLVPIVAHFAATLADDWGFHIFNSPENDDMLRESVPIRRMLETGKLNITNMPSYFEFGRSEKTSRLLADPWIWEQLRPEQENILFFQLDSIICSRSNQTPEDYFEYDWVGAPWPYSESPGGNGGLSIRKRSMLLKAIRDVPRLIKEAEDFYYSRAIRLVGGNVASKDVARGFSVEHIFHSRPLGIH